MLPESTKAVLVLNPFCEFPFVHCLEEYCLVLVTSRISKSGPSASKPTLALDVRAGAEVIPTVNNISIRSPPDADKDFPTLLSRSHKRSLSLPLTPRSPICGVTTGAWFNSKQPHISFSGSRVGSEILDIRKD